MIDETKNNNRTLYIILTLGFIAISIPSNAIFPKFNFYAELFIVLGLLLFIRKSTKSLFFHKYILWCFFWVFASLLPMIYNSNSLQEVINELRHQILMPIVMLLLGVVSQKKIIKYIPYIYMMTGLTNSIIMLLTVYLTPFGVKSPAGGYTGEMVRLYIHILYPSSFVGATGVMAYCAAAVFCIFFIFLPKVKLKILFIFTFLLSTYIAFYTGTRAMFFSVFLIFIVFIATSIKNNLIKYSKLIKYSYICLCVLIFGYIMCGDLTHGFNYLERFSFDYIYENLFSARLDIWHERINLLLLNPFGHGFSSLDVVYKSSHNNIIEIFYRFGWLSGVLFLIFLFFLVRIIYLINMKKANLEITVYSYVVLSQILYMNFEATIVSNLYTFYLFVFSAGILISYWHQETTGKQHKCQILNINY